MLVPLTSEGTVLTGAPNPDRTGAPIQLGTEADHLPFEPTGERLGSIAWRTWIYTDTGPARTRLGYLRAGEVFDARGPAQVNAGCPGGWYRINPRGFVCVGKGATLDLQHPVLRASAARAVRGRALPHVYVLSKPKPPHLYFTLPTREQLRDIEGDYESDALAWLLRHRPNAETPRKDFLELAQAAPPFLLQLGELTKPYGTKQGLRWRVHSGLASAASGFAVRESFEHQGRAWGLTTELDLIPLDKTKVVTPSALVGVALDPTLNLPVGLTTDSGGSLYQLGPGDKLVAAGRLPKRTPVKFTGQRFKQGGVNYWPTTEGRVVAEAGLTIFPPRTEFPSVATGSRKWLDISLRSQTLMAYEGKKAVFFTLISSGAGGLGDPEKVPSTVQGTFMIHSKHLTATMDGDDDAQSESFELRDVPYVQYFHKGYALHAAYWHDDFGRWRSHGCINLSPQDSAWLFEWTDPHLPAHWHSVLNQERGTVVHIHP